MSEKKNRRLASWPEPIQPGMFMAGPFTLSPMMLLLLVIGIIRSIKRRSAHSPMAALGDARLPFAKTM